MQLPTILAALSNILMRLSASLPRNRTLVPCHLATARPCRAIKRPCALLRTLVVLSSILVAHETSLRIDLAHVIGRRQIQNARQTVNGGVEHAKAHKVAIAPERIDLPDVTLRVRCSKGTYIRSIARDLGEKLSCGGHLTALRRTRSGAFSEQDLYTIEEVERMLSSAPPTQSAPSVSPVSPVK